MSDPDAINICLRKAPDPIDNLIVASVVVLQIAGRRILEIPDVEDNGLRLGARQASPRTFVHPETRGSAQKDTTVWPAPACDGSCSDLCRRSRSSVLGCHRKHTSPVRRSTCPNLNTTLQVCLNSATDRALFSGSTDGWLIRKSPRHAKKLPVKVANGEDTLSATFLTQKRSLCIIQSNNLLAVRQSNPSPSSWKKT